MPCLAAHALSNLKEIPILPILFPTVGFMPEPCILAHEGDVK